ncbi:MAG TPA: VOC family protein [Acidimicrobiales bacterium]|nr:VOC family protein [Acidimicrobiales bacterium]
MGVAMRVSHVPFRVWDREAAQKFFIDVLGFELHPRGEITYVRLGEVLIELLPAEEPEDPTTVPYVFGVEVEDLDAVVATALASGANVVRPPSRAISFWGRQAVISVPGGPPMALRQYEAPDGPTFAEWHPRA